MEKKTPIKWFKSRKREKQSKIPEKTGISGQTREKRRRKRMRQRSWDRGKGFAVDLAFDLGGGLLFAAGLSMFAAPAEFAPGGISGLVLILNHLWHLPLGLTTLALNLPLLLVSLRAVGGRFLIKSLCTMGVLTGYLDVIFPHLPQYTGNALLAALYSGVLIGAGMAFFYLRGSSSGGTDFLVVPIKKRYPHLPVGKVVMVFDLAVILLGWAAFGNLDAVLYGLISVAATSIVIDKILYGVDAGKLVLIITNRGKAVAEGISRRCARGATLVSGEGAYTGSERQILLCACSRAEAVRVRAAAWEEDQAAFVMIWETSEVFGEGFRPVQGEA